MIEDYLIAAALGAVGGVANFLVEDDWTSKAAIKAIVGGAIAGFVFVLAGFPNHLNSVLTGYAGLDVVKKLNTKFKLI